MALQKALKSVCEVCPGFPNQPLSITPYSSTTESRPSSSAQNEMPRLVPEPNPNIPNEPLHTSYYYRYSEPTPSEISPFELLPRELVWRIFDQVPECLREIRAASQTMMRHVSEYSMRHPNKPIVQYLRIAKSPKLNLQVEMTISRSMAGLFELRLIGNSSLFSQTGRVRGAEENKYYVYFHVYSCDRNVVDHLSTCMGNSLEKVEILDWDNRALCYSTITRLLDGKKLGNLEIKLEALSHSAVNELLFPLKDLKIDQITLAVREVRVPSPDMLLATLATFFQSIRINQLYIAKLTKNSRFFFGLHDFEWSSIILEMFEGKMDKLYISNFHFPQYLSAKSARILLKKLPRIEKKVWFEATCEVQVPAPVKDPDYYVRGNLITDGYFLRIKHASRIEE